jgi:hypothetical protein
LGVSGGAAPKERAKEDRKKREAKSEKKKNLSLVQKCGFTSKKCNKKKRGMPGGAVHMQRRARRPGINTGMC